jgi:uncharacterized iron-regulated membrane protein
MSFRKVLFWIHLAAGCLAGIVVLIMAVTGVVLAYQKQITSWVDRDFRSSPASGGARHLAVDTILTKVAAQQPGSPTVVTLHSDPTAPAEISFGREHVYMADAFSGAVLAESSARTRAFFQLVENWHRWLGVSVEHRAFGRSITGASNLGFLILVVSGPFLWLPRTWSKQSVKAVSIFRTGLSGRARDFNWHNVTGIWFALPLFVIVISGVVMSYPWANNLLYQLTGNVPPISGARVEQGPRQSKGERSAETRKGGSRQEKRNRPDSELEPSSASIDRLWVRAEQQVSGWQSITSRMAASADAPMVFTIDTGSGGRPDRRSQLTLDRRTAEVVRWEPFSSYNAGRRMRSWFRFLHTGEAGGFAGETVAGLASMGGAFLVWTGLWLALRRLASWRRRGRTVSKIDADDTVLTVSR